MDADKIQAAIVFHALYLNKCRECDGQVSNREEIELAEKAVRIVNVMNVDIEEPTE